MYRPCPRRKVSSFPSWKKLYTVPSRRAKIYAPSRPVEQTYTSKYEVYITPSSRTVVTIFIYRRPVPPWKKKSYSGVVHYRHVPSRKFTPPTVPSRPIQASISFIILPSRPVPSSNFSPPNMLKQYISSRPVSNTASHEKPCLVFFTWFQGVPVFDS